MSDTVWLALIGIIAMVIKEYFDQQRGAKTNVKVEEVKETIKNVTNDTADKLEELKVITDETKIVADETKIVADGTKKVGEVVHSLVNSAMSVQLRINEVALRRVSDLTNHPADIAAADLASKLSQEHEKRQAEINGKL